MNNPTPLDRRRLLVQIKQEHEDGCQAVVPAHPSVFALPKEIRESENIAREAMEAAKGQFEEEAASYLEYMREYTKTDRPDYPIDKLELYGRFNDEWPITFPLSGSFRAMKWEHGDGKPYEIMMLRVPVMISNAVFNDGEKEPVEPE